MNIIYCIALKALITKRHNCPATWRNNSVEKLDLTVKGSYLFFLTTT